MPAVAALSLFLLISCGQEQPSGITIPSTLEIESVDKPAQMAEEIIEEIRETTPQIVMQNMPKKVRKTTVQKTAADKTHSQSLIVEPVGVTQNEVTAIAVTPVKEIESLQETVKPAQPEPTIEKETKREENLFVADNIPQKDKGKPKKPITFAFGVHTGTDVGGAIPMPPGQAIGGDNKVNASLRLRPQFGLSATAIYNNRWSLTLEATYKMVALSAKAWVENQIFTDRTEDPWMEVSFRGTALTEMSFQMIEMPLYLRYTFGKGANRILLGGYYARVFNAKFESTPYKGMLFTLVDGKPDYSNPSSIVSPHDAYTHDFNDAMSKWDAGVLLGYERQIFIPGLLLGCRFSMGFNDIFQPDKKYLAYRMQHMRATLMVSYLFSKL